MLNISENYEKAFRDGEKDLQECDSEIAKNEEEIKKREEENRLLNARKQNILELREVLRKIIGEPIADIENQFSENTVENSKDTELTDSQSFFTTETLKGVVEVPTNAFKGFDNIVEATAHLLRIVDSPLKHSQIADTLLKGGYETKSVFTFSENVRSALRSASQNSKREIIWKDNFWQLPDLVLGSPNISSPPIEVNEPNKRRGVRPKWSKSIGDAAEDVLREGKALHLEEIHRRLAEMKIYPTIESLHATLRQDTRMRFKKVRPKTYKLAKKN